MTKRPQNQVYQIKVTLKGIRPPIWRRLLVPGNIDLYELHNIIQVAMGWENYHLHQFIIDGEYFSIPSEDDWEPVKDERKIRLSRVAPFERRKFVYEYDFGDSWEHEILVEKIMDPVPGQVYPVCIKGKRACPPEDVGGVPGYYGFLEAIHDPNHEWHEEYSEWIGDEFDPEKFDLDKVNAMLKGTA